AAPASTAHVSRSTPRPPPDRRRRHRCAPADRAICSSASLVSDLARRYHSAPPQCHTRLLLFARRAVSPHSAADARDTAMSELQEPVRRNRELWDDWAPKFVDNAEHAWREDPPTWGIWSVPESQVQMFPELAGCDAIELGCGTAY